MAAYGERPLGRGDEGPDVVELQMRLAGFRGTVPDGQYGPGTELQVMAFQRDVMKLAAPHGRTDQATLDAIQDFAADYPLDFRKLACECKVCGGFGRRLFNGEYTPGAERAEMYYRYEYPGIHRMILWALRGAMHYCRGKGLQLTINCGYRCSEHNRLANRTSTNHHGKAVDFDIQGVIDKRDDMRRCDEVRGLLVECANAQIGWGGSNCKSLEPRDIAPTWVHYDVRSYERRYLDDRYFVQSADALDALSVSLVS